MQKPYIGKKNFQKRKLPYHKKGGQQLHYKDDKKKFTTNHSLKKKKYAYRRKTKKLVVVNLSKEQQKGLNDKKLVIKNGKRKLRKLLMFLKWSIIILFAIGLLYFIFIE